MRALLIGGTGNISLSVTKRLLSLGWDVTLLNRGKTGAELPGAHQIICNIHDEKAACDALRGRHYDAVAQFIAYAPDEAMRDVRLFADKTDQYIFISSASCYEKPPKSPFITEQTPLRNPYWQYSRDKIACEEALREAEKEGFPLTIVRPSHTYGDSRLPVALHGGSPWQVVKRMLAGKPVLIPGDGTSLWTVTHAEDFAVGFTGLMGNKKALGQAVHITSDESLTWNAIHETIAEALGVRLRPLHVPSALLSRVSRYDFRGSLLGDKANSVVFDNSLIQSLVPEFKAAIPFREGVKRVLQHYMDNPALQKEDPVFDAFCDRVAEQMVALTREMEKL